MTNTTKQVVENNINFMGTVFKNCMDGKGTHALHIKEWIDDVKNCVYGGRVDLYRSLKAEGKDAQADGIKHGVPAFVCSSVCLNGRKRDDVPESVSNIGMIDYDIHSLDWSAEHRELAKNYRWIYGGYQTIGGGLRLFLVLPELPRENYSYYLEIALRRVDEIMGAEHDKQCTNFYRLNAASADPNAWYREDESELEFFPYDEDTLARIEKELHGVQPTQGDESFEMMEIPSIPYDPKRNYTDEEIQDYLYLFYERYPYRPRSRNNALLRYGTWCNLELFTTADLQALVFLIHAKYPYDEYPVKRINNRLLWGYTHPGAYASDRYKTTDDYNEQENDAEVVSRRCPTFGPDIYDRLPPEYLPLLEPADDDRARDFLLGGLTATSSALMGNLRIHYRGKAYSAHIAFCGVSPSGLGKSIALLPKVLVEPIQEELDKEYAIKYEAYKRAEIRWKREKSAAEKADREYNWKLHPGDPPVPEIFVQPGLCSKSSLIEGLRSSKHGIIIYEGELDVLSESQEQKFGKCESVYRLALANENISQKYLKNRLTINIAYPQMATVLTGTPDQFVAFIRSVNNGNLSRFAVLTGPSEPVWKNVHRGGSSKEREARIRQVYKEAASKTCALRQFLIDHPTEVYFTEEQELRIDELFSYCMNSIRHLQRTELASVITRGAILLARLCGTFTGLRKARLRDTTEELYIDDDIFEIAIAMTKVFLRHILQWSTILPKDKTPRQRMKEVISPKEVLDLLSDTFTKDEMLAQIAATLRVGRTKAYEILKDWRKEGKVENIGKGLYAKIKK